MYAVSKGVEAVDRCFGRTCCVERMRGWTRELESPDGSSAYSRGFTRVGGHGCFLNHSLPLHTSTRISLSLSLVFLRSPLPLSSLVVVVVETSNNVPNDRLFSSGDVHLPANRKPVKMNPLNREQVHTDQLCNSFEERDTNKSSRRSKQEAFCAGRNARHEVEIFESSFPI